MFSSSIRSTSFRSVTKDFLLLTLFSISVYLFVSLKLHRIDNPLMMDKDEQEYYFYAGSLLRHQYIFDLRRPLVHVALIYFFRVITGDNLVATRALAAAFFGLSGPLMYILARRFTGDVRFALGIGLVTILWPPFVYYGSSLYSEATALPLFILMLIAFPMGSLIASGGRDGWTAAGVAGIFLGSCMLVRPMYLIFSPFVAAILFLEEADWRTAARR